MGKTDSEEHGQGALDPTGPRVGAQGPCLPLPRDKSLWTGRCSQAWGPHSSDHETGGVRSAWPKWMRSHTQNVGQHRVPGEEGAPLQRAPLSGSIASSTPQLPTHLVARREGGQLLDLGGLVVAAPPAEQHLAADPLRGLGGGTWAWRAAHHVVEVLQVLCGDRLVVVTILREEDLSQGEPSPRAGASRPHSGWAPDGGPTCRHSPKVGR